MRNQLLLLSACFIGLSSLSACTQDHKGNMALQRLEVHQEQHSAEFTSHNLTQDMLEGIAADYNRNGDTAVPLTLMVQYDPSSAENTAMNATHHATKIAKGLREAGVQNVKAEIMPVNHVGDHSKTLVTYDRFSAHAPSGCDGLMPGLNNTRTDWERTQSYQYGCTVETTIAKQISRPKDLVGRSGFETPSDGRRASNIIEGYRYGTPNEALEGESATED